MHITNSCPKSSITSTQSVDPATTTLANALGDADMIYSILEGCQGKPSAALSTYLQQLIGTTLANLPSSGGTFMPLMDARRDLNTTGTVDSTTLTALQSNVAADLESFSLNNPSFKSLGTSADLLAMGFLAAGAASYTSSLNWIDTDQNYMSVSTALAQAGAGELFAQLKQSGLSDTDASAVMKEIGADVKTQNPGSSFANSFNKLAKTGNPPAPSQRDTNVWNDFVKSPNVSSTEHKLHGQKIEKFEALLLAQQIESTAV